MNRRKKEARGRSRTRRRQDAVRPQRHFCRECGCKTSDLYWWLFQGCFRPQMEPLCSRCYETLTRRHLRESFATIDPPPRQQDEPEE